MARQLTSVQPLPPGDHGPTFRAAPAVWLTSARPAGPDAWQLRLRVGGVSRLVRCQVGDPWTTRDGVQRRVVWTPLSEDRDVLPVERLLPTLDGELFLVGASATPSLVLAGAVDVPFGRLGDAVDAVVLGRVAQRTAAAFLQDVANGIGLAESAAAAQLGGSGTHQRS